MKYDIKILPLTKSNLEKFEDSNNGFDENFVDIGFKKNFNKYIEDLVKNFRTLEYFENTNTELVGGFRRGYTVNWLDSPESAESFNRGSRTYEIENEVSDTNASLRTTSASLNSAAGIIAFKAFGAKVGGILGGPLIALAAGGMDYAGNKKLADKLNDPGEEYSITNYRNDRGANPAIKDPYIDGPDFSFIFSMLKMRLGNILLGPKGFRKYIQHMNNKDGENDLDINNLESDDAIERAMKLTLQQMTSIIGEPNPQYRGVVGANAAANLGAGMLTNFPILNLFLTNPRFEFTIENPTTGEKHTWSQGSLIGASPPWGRDCEDGWDWASCSCETVSTDDINTYMSIWDTYNTNDCDYFGRNKFNPHFSERYPEGRYYCDSSIHQIRAYCPNQNSVRDEFAGAVDQKLFCDDVNQDIDTIIGEQHGNPNWCESNPNAIKHQSCTSTNCNNQLLRQSDGKLNINYENVGFSAHSDFRNKNFPVPPIIHYNGGAYHPGLGDTYENECKDNQQKIKLTEDQIWEKYDGSEEDSGYELGGSQDKSSRLNGRTELGNHLFYKFNSNNTDTTPRCASINDRNCNPCHNVKQEFCGPKNEWPWGRYAMCEWTNNKCRPKDDYQIDFSNTNVQGGSYFDASFKIDESMYSYDRNNDGVLSKHPRYNQYAKYIDCRRHGLDDMQCINPHIMSHLEKWCDALGIDDGYESWNDDSFGYDYRYNIMKIDMIPDAFTDYTVMDHNSVKDGKPELKHKANWIGLQKPKALGYSTYKIAPWENAFGGFNGHTDAMPGGNYALNKNDFKTEPDSLLFLNRGYCPTRFYEDGSSRYASTALNNYDDPIAFGYGPYSPHSHIAAGEKEAELTGRNSLGVCTWLNFRAQEHSKALSQWLSDHNTHHKIIPSFSLVNENQLSNCTLSSINSAINKLELCRRYGIGGIDKGQIYFLDPSFIYTEEDKRCNLIPSESCSAVNSLCELENGKCQSKIGNSIRRDHGSHLFENCSASTIMDFENICERLNIPVYQSNSTRFFNTYKCNARDVVRRFKYCEKNGVNVARGEVCDESLIQAKAMATKNQTMYLTIIRNSWFSLTLTSINQRRHNAINDLEKSQDIEVELQVLREEENVNSAIEIASIEQDSMIVSNNYHNIEKFNKEAEEKRLCVLWNLGDNETEPLKYQKPVKDPFNSGVDITKKKDRISQINKKCNTYKEPFPRKILIGFVSIIILILIIAFLKT